MGEELTAILGSVIASVLANRICKWLDKDRTGTGEDEVDNDETEADR